MSDKSLLADLAELETDCEQHCRVFDANWTAWAADVTRRAAAALRTREDAAARPVPAVPPADEDTPTARPVTQDDIDRLEKVAWDANVEYVVIYYRDLIEQLRERIREADRAARLERQRAVRAERAALTPPPPVSGD